MLTRENIIQSIHERNGKVQVNLSDMGVSAEDFPLIVEVLQSQEKIDYLDLSRNNILPKGAELLVKDLLQSLPVAAINFDTNHLKNSGALYLLTLPHLLRLDISRNGLTEEIVPHILENKTLKFLNIEGNENITEESLKKIKAHIQANNLAITTVSLGELAESKLQSKEKIELGTSLLEKTTVSLSKSSTIFTSRFGDNRNSKQKISSSSSTHSDSTQKTVSVTGVTLSTRGKK